MVPLALVVIDKGPAAGKAYLGDDANPANTSRLSAESTNETRHSASAKAMVGSFPGDGETPAGRSHAGVVRAAETFRAAGSNSMSSTDRRPAS